MAVPKRKTSKSKKRMRRSHSALTPVNISFDKETGEARLPHHATPSGNYNGRTAIRQKVAEESQQSEDSASA
jgi:large subunit ribosomal protein L32